VDHDGWLGDEHPTERADIAAYRERTGIKVKGSALGLNGELEVTAAGSTGSPTTRAITMLIIVATACVCAIVVTLIAWLAHAPGPVLVLAALVVLAALLIAGVIIAFHVDKQLSAVAPRPGPQQQGRRGSTRNANRAAADHPGSSRSRSRG